MWHPFDIGIAIAKLAVCIVGGFMAWKWHLIVLSTVTGHPVLMGQMPLYDAMLATGFLAGSLALLTFRRDNARRVVLNTLVILGCIVLLVIPGTLVRFATTSEPEELIERPLYLGIAGAALGLLLTQIRSALGIFKLSKRRPSNANSGSSDKQESRISRSQTG